MAGLDQLGGSTQAAFVLVSLATYFFLIGLLNSRPRPQIVSSRLDFIVLNACMFPAFCLPAASVLAGAGWVMAGAMAAAMAMVAMLAPRRWSGWTIYNIAGAEALRAVERALDDTGETFRRTGRTLRLTGSDARVKLRSVPLLRNVSVSVEGPDASRIAQAMDPAMHRELSQAPARANAAGATLLLAATAMIIAPLGMFADRMPEMVRLITDLVK